MKESLQEANILIMETTHQDRQEIDPDKLQMSEATPEVWAIIKKLQEDFNRTSG